MRNPIVVAILLLLPMSLLSGCGLSKSDMAAPEPVAGPALGGHVHGGQQPVSGSRVYMFQAHLGNYGDAAESRLDGAAIAGNPAGGGNEAGETYVLTDASGDFTITGGYTCTAGRPVYLLAMGGNPGSGTGVDNDKLALMAVLGPCPAGRIFSSSEEVIINEATTVAAAYALSGFLTGPMKLSAPNETLARTGLTNATANAGQLVDISTGLARTVTPGGNGIVPQQEIYTLANIIAACVNTDGTDTDMDDAPTGCYSVLNGVEGYSAPDTISLMLHVVGSPGPKTVANLIALSTKTSPFQPALTATPNDFTVAIGFSGGGLGEPQIPAVDAEGNVWFPNASTSTLSGLSPLGVALTPDEGVSLVARLLVQAAVDPDGNIWISNQEGVVAKVTYSPPNFAKAYYLVNSGGGPDAGLDDVHQIAIDSAGNVYVSDYTDGTIYKLGNDGLPAFGYVPSTIAGFEGVALLSDTNFYSAYGLLSTSVSGQEFTSNGEETGELSSCASLDTTCGLFGPSAFAVDSVGGVWATNSLDSSYSSLAHFSLTAITGTGAGGGGLQFDNDISYVNWLAIDGGDHVWVANFGGRSVSEFDDTGAALSPGTTGFVSGKTACAADGLAIDGSGDVWVSCDSNTTPVVEFIGAAVPVYTPLTPGHFGVRP